MASLPCRELTSLGFFPGVPVRSHGGVTRGPAWLRTMRHRAGMTLLTGLSKEVIITCYRAVNELPHKVLQDCLM